MWVLDVKVMVSKSCNFDPKKMRRKGVVGWVDVAMVSFFDLGIDFRLLLVVVPIIKAMGS